MMLSRWLTERVAYPLWERWNGARDLDRLRELLANERLSPGELRDLQRRRLRAMLEHAYRTVPFYRRRFDEAGLDPSRVEDPSQLDVLPVLTKLEVNKNLDALISSTCDRAHLIKGSTSGSTGEPLRFYLTEEKKSFVRAATLRENSWLGCGVGDRILRFWSSPRDFAPTLKARIGTAWVRRTRVVNGYDASERQIERFLEELRRFRPIIVIGYGKSLLLAAQYVRHTHASLPYRPRAVVVTAEGLSREQRSLLVEVFGAPVVNRYATRELGQIASSCSLSHRLHTVDDGCVVELLPLPGGPEGFSRIVVTDLVNEAMPLIRYDTGDVGLQARGTCPCGRPYGMIEEVEGRVVDLFVAPDGQHYHPFKLFDVFDADPDVRCYQLVQESRGFVRARVCPFDMRRPPKVARLRASLEALVPRGVDVDVELCESLPPAASGKRRFAISNVTDA